MGSSGPVGPDLEALQGWILKFGEDSARLRTSVETFLNWLANGVLPWRSYRSFTLGRLLALDKQPGLRPVVVGETRRRLLANILLKVTVPEATMACHYYQFCARLKAGIDSAIHRVQSLWYENLTTEDWGFLLVDARNTFNNINRVRTLWTVRHLWLSGARFVFNCYRHW